MSFWDFFRPNPRRKLTGLLKVGSLPKDEINILNAWVTNRDVSMSKPNKKELIEKAIRILPKIVDRNARFLGEGAFNPEVIKKAELTIEFAQDLLKIAKKDLKRI